MKKLSLKLEDLQVDTFGTTPDADGRRGTVRANADTGYYDCPFTNNVSCGETCGCSGDETCPEAGCPLSYWTDCHRCG